MRKSARSFYRPRWKDRLTFTLRERRGLYVLAMLLCVEAGVLHFLRYYHEPMDRSDWLELITQADSILAVRESDRNTLFTTGDSASAHEDSEEGRPALHAFDPNRCSSADWRSLGLSARQSDAVMKYAGRTGGFRSVDDLRKVRAIPPDLLDAWLPYLRLPSNSNHSGTRRVSVAVTPLDINSADSAAFERLKGIGPSMAGRIVRYRSVLGGFHSTDQLKEVYGFSDSLFSMICASLVIEESFRVHRLDLNRTPADSLRRHPYVGYRLSLAIEKYRSQHPFRSLEELHRLPLVTPEYFRKFAPYLKVGD